MVRRIRRRRVAVYDLQVEGCRNFFAEGILVHNCLIIDDPYASPQEAYSSAIRESVWTFWNDSARPRLSADTNVVLMFHRYHQDDLAGRLLANERGWEVLRYAAEADGDDDCMPEDRPSGEFLSDRFSVEWWEKQKESLLVWLAQFQGRPTAKEGLFFHRGWFRTVGAAPASGTFVRYWDKAGAAPGKGDYTVGVLMCETERMFVVVDVVRGQWQAAERNIIIKQTAVDDRARYGDVRIRVEQPPGLGKESTDTVVRLLSGYPVAADPVHRDKVERAEPFQAQAQAGNVQIVEAGWNRDYLDELAAFPNGLNDDQVDASSGGFNALHEPRSWALDPAAREFLAERAKR